MLEKLGIIIKSQPLTRVVFKPRIKLFLIGLGLSLLAPLEFLIKIELDILLALAGGISFFKPIFGKNILCSKPVFVLYYLEDLFHV